MTVEDSAILESDEVKTAINAAVEKATSGLLENRDTILKEKKELASKLKELSDKYSSELDSLKSELANQSKKKDDGAPNFDELLAKKESEIRSSFESRLEEAQKTAEENAKRSEFFQQELISRTISDTIRDAALKAGVQPEAVDDVVSRGLQTFSLSENGEVEARDSNGDLVKDEDNYVMTPSRFMNYLKKTKPYYWGQSASGGLSGTSAHASSDHAAKLAEAAAKGDMETYRKLREKK